MPEQKIGKLVFYPSKFHILIPKYKFIVKIMMERASSPVVNNQLIRIGVLLIDMDRNLDFEIDHEQLEFLESEFKRISETITDVWADKPIGLAYFLEFHLAEAKRLKNKIKLKNYLKDEMNDLDIFRLNIYALLKRNLSNLVALLNKLLKGEGIALNLK